MSTRTAEWVREYIQQFKKRAQILARRPLLDEEDDNEDLQELITLEHTIGRWEIALKFLELYERQPTVDADAEAVWVLLAARFPWNSRPAENDEELTAAATHAMTTGGAVTYELMREFVYLQNRGPFEYYLMPREFMRGVVRLGLMNRVLKVDAPRPAGITAVGQ